MIQIIGLGETMTAMKKIEKHKNWLLIFAVVCTILLGLISRDDFWNFLLNILNLN